MNIDYLVRTRTNGANPFTIFDFCSKVDQSILELRIKQLPYEVFLSTAYWFSVSQTAKANAGMRCQVCNGCNELNVHHRTYDTHGREHSNMMDLVVLCSRCHGLFHGHVERKPIKELDIDDGTIPDSDPVILTSRLVEMCRTEKGGFTNSTLDSLNVPRRGMTRGWAKRLIGTSVSRENFIKAVNGRIVFGVRKTL